MTTWQWRCGYAVALPETLHRNAAFAELHETFGFMSAKAPSGLALQAQTWSS